MHRQQMGPVTEKKFCELISKDNFWLRIFSKILDQTVDDVMNERDNYNRMAYRRENQISLSETSMTDARSKDKKTMEKQKTTENQKTAEGL